MDIRENMLPVLGPKGGEEEIEALRDVIESGWWGKGPKVAEFEEKFAEMVGLHEKIYLHAEISALISNKSNAITFIVERLSVDSGNELRNAKPCPVCSLALKHAGIKHIYYSTDDGFLYQYHK